MTTDPASITAFFTGLATLLASVGALLLSWRAASSAAAVNTKTEAVAKTADTLLVKTAEIHTLTNDAKSKADAALAVANETIKGLQILNASLKSDPATLATIPPLSSTKSRNSRHK